MTQFPGKESLISVSPLILAQLEQGSRPLAARTRGIRKPGSPVREDIISVLNSAFSGSAGDLRQSW